MRLTAAMPSTLRWFHAGFDVRALSEARSSCPRSVRLWIGAQRRTEAVRIAADREIRLVGRAESARRTTERHGLVPFVPGARQAIPAGLGEIAERPWAMLEGCLVQAVPDADVIAAEWLEATNGDVTSAEQALNRLHLWDTLDDDEEAGTGFSDAVDDLALGAAIARAWQRRLACVSGAGAIVVELTIGSRGPELTAFRPNVDRVG